MKKILSFLTTLVALTGIAYAGATVPIQPSANIYPYNGQVTVDRVATSTLNGYVAFGTSFTCGTGGSGPYNPYPSQIALDMGTTLTNYCQSGDTATDGAIKVFTDLNPTDLGNPVVTAEWGRNEVFHYGTGAVAVFKKAITAIAVGATTSQNNRFLAGNTTYFTQAGTWAADTTFTNYNGLTSSTAGSTLTGTFQIGPPGVFYIIYKMTNTAGSGTFNVSVGGVPLTDTISNAQNVSTDYTGDAPVNNGSTISVGAARYSTTSGSHSIAINYNSGTTTILGIWIPSNSRAGGVSAPRIFMGNMIPEQGNVTASSDLLYNNAMSQILLQAQNDGLYAYPVDLNSSVDPLLDFSATTTQNCTTSGANLPVHPNNCGYKHMAQRFEAAINPVGVVVTNNASFTGTFTTTGAVTGTQFKSAFSTTTPLLWDVNTGDAFGTTNLGSGIRLFDHAAGAFTSIINFEYDPTNALYATNTSYGTSTEVSWKTCPNNYTNPTSCTLRAWLDGSGNYTANTLSSSASRRGNFTCTAAGTINIANANMLSTSNVIISMQSAGGTITTPPAMKTVTGGTGFSVLCGATDTSIYNYMIMN